MFKNLRLALDEAGITIRTLAQVLQIQESTVQNKLNGETDWKWSEVLMIKGLIPRYSLEWLMTKVER